jgi:hypothetical protein
MTLPSHLLRLEGIGAVMHPSTRRPSPGMTVDCDHFILIAFPAISLWKSATQHFV